MKFNFFGTKKYSNEQIDEAKTNFLKDIAPFEAEFNQGEVFVNINLDTGDYNYSSNKVIIGNLILKVNKYKKDNNL